MRNINIGNAHPFIYIYGVAHLPIFVEEMRILPILPIFCLYCLYNKNDLSNTIKLKTI